METDPKVTVVMPVYNEEELVGKAIQSLLDQTYKDIEVIVIDDGSTDNTVEKVKQFSSIRLIQQEHSGTGKSWNLGAKLAKGKIMILFAGDMQAPNNFVEKLVRPIINGEAVGTLHDVEYVLNDNNILARCWSAKWGKYKGKYVSYVSNVPSGWAQNFGAILIDEYLKFGGLDPKKGYADDTSFSEKSRFKIIYGCYLYHNQPGSIKEAFLQSRWIGGSLKLKNMWKKLLIALIGVIAYFGIALNFLSFLNSVLIFILLLLLAVIIESLRVSMKVRDYRMFFAYPVFLIVKGAGNILGYFRRIVFKKYAR